MIENYKMLEDVVRDSYASVVWSHKIQEKQAIKRKPCCLYPLSMQKEEDCSEKITLYMPVYAPIVYCWNFRLCV